VKADEANVLTADELDTELKAKLHIMDTEIGRIFRRLDEDASGTLDRDEFRKALVILNLKTTNDEYDKLMDRYDPDGDGITYREFLLQFGKDLQGQDGQGSVSDVMHRRAVQHRNQRAEKHDTKLKKMSAEEVHQELTRILATMSEEIHRAFRKFDDDASGVLSHGEFRQLINQFNLHMANSEFKKLMQRYDPDHDGVSFREFVLAFGLNDHETKIELGALLGQRSRETKQVRMQAADKRAELIQRNRQMNADEVHQALGNKLALMTNEVRRAFRKIDEDASGVLSHSEFHNLLIHWNIHTPKDEFKKLMRRYDPDHDGISYREFLHTFGETLQAKEGGPSSLAHKMFESRRHSMNRRNNRILINAGQKRRSVGPWTLTNKPATNAPFESWQNQEADEEIHQQYSPGPPAKPRRGRRMSADTSQIMQISTEPPQSKMSQPDSRNEQEASRGLQIVKQIANLLQSVKYRLLTSVCKQYDSIGSGNIANAHLSQALLQLGIRMRFEDAVDLYQHYRADDQHVNYRRFTTDIRKAMDAIKHSGTQIYSLTHR